MSPAAATDSVLVSGQVALSACAAMAVFYVAVLYAPTVVLRLRTPVSRDEFFLRRFACAAGSSAASVAGAGALLRLGNLKDTSTILSVFGLRSDHLWQAVAIPLFLTSLVYTGSLVCKLGTHNNNKYFRGNSYNGNRSFFQKLLEGLSFCARDVMAWRNYVVAPITEELVFRACMIPLLLCGGFRIYNIIFLSPIFFSLAHLNHFLELYYQAGYTFMRAFLIVGLQLGYTIVFGWYSAFLFIRTENLLAPIIAHMFCNFMGLPVLYSPRPRGLATVAFIAGLVCFFALLWPLTNPILYNNSVNRCKCWHGYCYWS